MTNTNLTIKLNKRNDAKGKVYYVGKLDAPMDIDCRNPGVVFLVFTSEDGKEQLQIASMDEDD